MAETVARMQLAKNGDFKVNREQRTSTGQSGTKHDRWRLPERSFRAHGCQLCPLAKSGGRERLSQLRNLA
jgi:hypothetical protein